MRTPAPTQTPPQSLGLTVENVQTRRRGTASVTAQVANLGTEEMRVAKVVIDLYDANGGRVTRMPFSPGLPTLKPGEGATWEGQWVDLEHRVGGDARFGRGRAGHRRAP